MIEGNLEHLPTGVLDKIQSLKETLEEDYIDVKKLRRLATDGIPDQVPQIRQLTWKILLRYLPEKRQQWKSVEHQNKKTYEALVERFLSPKNYPQYPILLTKSHPQYLSRLKDYELWQQIQKDVARTHFTINFFSQKSTNAILIPYFTQPRRQKFKTFYCQNNYQQFLSNKQKQRENYNYDFMSRILFIYSKLNPNVGYVQGMNEILAPIFFVVNKHKNPSQIDDASCFYMLNSLLAQVIDLHIADMDGSSDGIYGKVNLINRTLKIIEPVLWLQLRVKNVDPVCYNFKWLVLLFAQQFQLFDVCRLWDTLLTYKDIKMYLICLSLSVIQIKSKQIDENQGIDILKSLQQLRQQNILEIISIANQIYQMIGKKDLQTLIWENKRQQHQQ